MNTAMLTPTERTTYSDMLGEIEGVPIYRRRILGAG